MNASELSRKLLFYGADDVTRYLEHTPFNQYLHALLVDAMHSQQVEVPMVTLFNELQYQCAHINYDATPGENIAGRYLAEAETWLGAHAAAQLVFCVVYSLLRIKQNITFHEECMLRQLPQLFTDGFGELSDDITKEFHAAQVRVPEVFATMTWPIDQLPESREAWPTVTCNYSPYVIEKLILLVYGHRAKGSVLLKTFSISRDLNATLRRISIGGQTLRHYALILSCLGSMTTASRQRPPFTIR